MSVEILSVALDDQTIEAIAQRVAVLMGAAYVATQSNPPSSQNPQGAERSGSGGQGDPWMNQGGAPSNQGQQNQGYQNQGQQYQGGQQSGQQNQQGFNCAHGAMIFQPAGTNRNTNEPYPSYYKCPLERGVQGRCRNVYPGR